MDGKVNFSVMLCYGCLDGTIPGRKFQGIGQNIIYGPFQFLDIGKRVNLIL